MKYAVLYYKKDPFGEKAVSIAVVVQNSNKIKVHFFKDYLQKVLAEDAQADTYIMRNINKTIQKQVDTAQIYESSPSLGVKLSTENPNYLSALASGYRGNVQFLKIEETKIPNMTAAVRELERIFA